MVKAEFRAYKKVLLGCLLVLGAGLAHFFILCLVEFILLSEGVINYDKTRGYLETIKMGFKNITTLPHMLLSLCVLLFGVIYGFKLIMRGINNRF